MNKQEEIFTLEISELKLRVNGLEDILKQFVPPEKEDEYTRCFTIWDNTMNNVTFKLTPLEKVIYSILHDISNYHVISNLLGKNPKHILAIIHRLREQRFVIGFDPITTSRTKYKTVVPYKVFRDLNHDVNTTVVYLKMLHYSKNTKIFTDPNFLREALPVLTPAQISRAKHTLEDANYISRIGKNLARVNIIQYRDYVAPVT